MWKLILLLTVLCVSQLVHSYKILVIFPIPGKSHSILGNGFVRNLLADGHEVTYITSFVEKNPSANLHQVDVSSNMDLMGQDIFNITALLNKEVSMNDLGIFLGMSFKIATSTVGHENVQKLLKDPQQQFDLIIAEWMFTDFYAGFQAVFKCPYIWYSSVEPHWMVLRLIDENPNPAYTPDIMSEKMPPFTFAERMQSLLAQLIIPVYKYLFMENLELDAYKKYYGPAAAVRGHILPPFKDVVYNASLLFGNSHVSMGSPVRLPQSYKPIGGYHIDTKTEPLPEDLKKIMEENRNGVIYFSMGSGLKSKDLPESIKKSLLETFGSLKQTVLWKFEEDFPNLPKNVHILKWAPQQSILAHPNCILFITHGGLLSTTETIKFGKPVIGIPVFADQFANVARAVEKGFAKRVDLSYEVASELKVAIEDIISNPKYYEKAKELSFVYHDRPTSPSAELLHWTRHVIATRGATHLRSPALAVPCWQKLYLDLAALLLTALTLLCVAFNKLCCRKKVVVSADKKKK